MEPFLSRRLLAAAAFLALGTVAPLAPARADGLIDSFMGMLGVEDDKPEITYRERAPLVVPPNNNLRPPEVSKVEGNPAWPQDPDVMRRKQADLLKKYPAGVPESERRRFNGERASAGEMSASRSAKSTYSDLNARNTLADKKGADWLRPDEMAEGAKAGSQAVASGVEPDRRFLTDPPTGLRKPSANAEFKAPRIGGLAGKDRSDDPSVIDAKPRPEIE